MQYKEQTKLLEQQGEITTTTKEEGLVMPHLLLGMTLASTQDKFLFVEEWKYVLLNQVMMTRKWKSIPVTLSSSHLMREFTD